MDVKKLERVPFKRQFGRTFGIFGHCKRILDTLKSFCYFRDLDMAPIYAVPGFLLTESNFAKFQFQHALSNLDEIRSFREVEQSGALGKVWSWLSGIRFFGWNLPSWKFLQGSCEMFSLAIHCKENCLGRFCKEKDLARTGNVFLARSVQDLCKECIFFEGNSFKQFLDTKKWEIVISPLNLSVQWRRLWVIIWWSEQCLVWRKVV